MIMAGLRQYYTYVHGLGRGVFTGFAAGVFKLGSSTSLHFLAEQSKAFMSTGLSGGGVSK